MALYNYLRWIKNVKRDNGNDWAYYADADNSEFPLAFGPDHAGGAVKPELGDLIVLFQTITNEKIASPSTYLTHLVEVMTGESVSTGQADYPIGRLVRVLARVEPATQLKSNVIRLSFQHVNSGQLCDIKYFNPSETELTNKQRLIELFLPYF